MTEDQLRSQVLGLSLAVATAIGCIAYEKLVKNFSFGIVVLAAFLFYVPTMAWCATQQTSDLLSDLNKLVNSKTMLFGRLFTR